MRGDATRVVADEDLDLGGAGVALQPHAREPRPALVFDGAPASLSLISTQTRIKTGLQFNVFCMGES